LAWVVAIMMPLHYFLSISQLDVFADIIQNSAVENISLKTEESAQVKKELSEIFLMNW
jgi:hypothetical protein